MRNLSCPYEIFSFLEKSLLHIFPEFLGFVHVINYVTKLHVYKAIHLYLAFLLAS